MDDLIALLMGTLGLAIVASLSLVVVVGVFLLLHLFRSR
jgi:hypothetical protein